MLISLTLYFFGNTNEWRNFSLTKQQRKCFYLQHGILDLLLVLQDLWSLSLLVLRRNGVMRCWEGSVCCGRVRDCVFCIFDERHVAVVGIKLWMSPWVSCLVFGGEYALYPLMWTSGELGACVSRAGLRSDRHSQCWGDIKLYPCKACWMRLIYIQLGFLVINP